MQFRATGRIKRLEVRSLRLISGGGERINLYRLLIYELAIVLRGRFSISVLRFRSIGCPFCSADIASMNLFDWCSTSLFWRPYIYRWYHIVNLHTLPHNIQLYSYCINVMQKMPHILENILHYFANSLWTDKFITSTKIFRNINNSFSTRI